MGSISLSDRRPDFRVKPDPSRLDLQIYPFSIDIPARFADVDPQWHLNNVRIAEFYQEARISFNHALSDDIDLDRNPEQRILVARQAIDYLAEVQWPGLLTIGIGVSHIGGASFTLAMAMFQADRCVGLSEAILVYANRQGAARLPEQLRDALNRRELRTEWLFSYGTLQDPAVQRANFGRLLSGRREALTGYVKNTITIRDPLVIETSGLMTHEIIEPSARSAEAIPGTVYAITPQELAAADRYEVADYRRVTVTLLSGRKAWAYVRA